MVLRTGTVRFVLDTWQVSGIIKCSLCSRSKVITLVTIPFGLAEWLVRLLTLVLPWLLRVPLSPYGLANISSCSSSPLYHFMVGSGFPWENKETREWEQGNKLSLFCLQSMNGTERETISHVVSLIGTQETSFYFDSFAGQLDNLQPPAQPSNHRTRTTWHIKPSSLVCP